MQEKMDLARQKELNERQKFDDAERERSYFTQEEVKRYEAREHELIQYRHLIQEQEKEFERYRAKQKQDQMRRERELQSELEAREKLFADRERQFIERQREFEAVFGLRQAEMDSIRLKLEHEIAKREVELADALWSRPCIPVPPALVNQSLFLSEFAWRQVL